MRTGAWPAIVLAAAALVAPAGASAPLDAREIVRASEARMNSRTEHTYYEMELVDAGGKAQQVRTVDVYYKRERGREVTLQKFRSPPIVAGTGMMIIDSGAEANDIWMYLPASRRLRRISGAEKSNWYMGTEFTYEDFEDYQIELYQFRLLREDACLDGRRCHVIEALAATPAERKASGYLKKIYWIEQESLYPVVVEYLGKDGAVAKRLSGAGLARVGGYWRVARLEMHNLANGRVTRIRVLKRAIDTPLDDYYLSKRYLRTD